MHAWYKVLSFPPLPSVPPCTHTAFFYNAIIILATLFAGIQRPGLQWWFLSLLVITLGVPLSWWLFYKSIFNAAQTDGATYSYIRSFMLTLLHMVGLVGGCVCVVFGFRGVWYRMRVNGPVHASPRRHTPRHCTSTACARVQCAGCWLVTTPPHPHPECVLCALLLAAAVCLSVQAWCVWMILGIDNLGEFSAGEGGQGSARQVPGSVSGLHRIEQAGLTEHRLAAGGPARAPLSVWWLLPGCRQPPR